MLGLVHVRTSRSNPEEVQWCAYNKRTGAAVEEKCERCARFVAHAYPLKTWDVLISELKANPVLRDSVMEAMKVFCKEKPFRHRAEDFVAGTQCGYRTERHLLFMDAAQVEEKYGVKLRDVSVPIDVIQDETGKLVEGLLIRNPAEPLLHVTLFHTASSTLTEQWHAGASQVRQSQGSDVCAWYRSDVRKTTSKGFKSQTEIYPVQKWSLEMP